MIIRTGVGAHISAAHADVGTGALHGHTWEVTAWFEADQDALALQAELIRICATFDHGILPAGLARGEDLAAKILEMAGDHCVEVEIRRPLERLYAKAVR